MSSRFSAVSSPMRHQTAVSSISGRRAGGRIKADGILARARVKQKICDYPYQRSSGLFGCGHAAYGRRSVRSTYLSQRPRCELHAVSSAVRAGCNAEFYLGRLARHMSLKITKSSPTASACWSACRKSAAGPYHGRRGGTRPTD